MTSLPQVTAIRPEPWSKKAWKSIRDFARAKPLGMAAAIVFIIMILVAILGSWITPYDPLDTNVRARLLAPSWEHIMGTDNLGRDVFSRLIAGTRIAILIGITASFIGSTIGVLLGVISGYLGGKFDLYFQRLMDMIMAFPYLILAIAIMAVLGGSIQNVIFAIAFPMIPSGNRIARSIAISVRESTFIEAARSLGARQVRIIFRHVLPNAIAAYLIVLTSALGASILAEASLSFLGLGVPPPHPSWGRALNEAMSYFYNAPWLAIFPGIAISLAVFSANLFGDALRDIWDPRLKRV
jgi:peptide/nickel transport system permease protein